MTVRQSSVIQCNVMVKHASRHAVVLRSEHSPTLLRPPAEYDALLPRLSCTQKREGRGQEDGWGEGSRGGLMGGKERWRC